MNVVLSFTKDQKLEAEQAMAATAVFDALATFDKYLQFLINDDSGNGSRPCQRKTAEEARSALWQYLSDHGVNTNLIG